MEREIRINAIEVEGHAITVGIEGNTEEYAMSFLHIFNNVRANSELLKVRNYYDNNDVTVYCELDAKDYLVRYLKTFGKIKSCEKVVLYQMEEPNYDVDKYYDAIIIPEFV